MRYTYRAVVVLLFVLCLFPETSHAVPLVQPGDIFTIPIPITGAVDLSSFQFDLSFDATVLRVTATGVTEDSFFTQGDITVFNPGVVDNTNGNILGISDALIFQAPVNGAGPLVNVEFRAIALGVSPLTLSNVFLNLSNPAFAISLERVTVIPAVAPVPEPGTLTLLGVGLAGLSMYRGALRQRRQRVALALRPP